MALDKIIVEYLLDKKKFDQQTKDIEKQLEGTEDAAKEATKGVSGEMDKLGGVVKKLGGFIAGAFAAEKVISFGKELVEIQKKAQGIQGAFDRLNNPAILNQLQRATKGTVTNLNLMQRAVQAKNYNIPLKELSTLFEFARRRAKDTGEEVDVLVDKIVLGLGRKSPLILDDLGVSSHRLRQALNGVTVEASSVGQFVQAFGDIAREELAAMGEDVLTLNERIEQNRVMWENLKLELSNELLPVMNEVAGVMLHLTKVTTTDKVPWWEKLLAAGSPQAYAKMVSKIVVEEAAAAADRLTFLQEIQETANNLNDSGALQDIIYSYQKMLDVSKLTAEDGNERVKELEEGIGILQARIVELANTTDAVAIVSIATLSEEIKTLQDRINNAQIGSFEFEQATAQLSAKQEKLNDVMENYNALLKARSNMEEDLSDDFDVVDDDLSIPGVPTPGQEDDLIAETKRIQGRLRESWDQFNDEQEESNTKFFETNAASMVNRSSEFVSAFSEFASNIAQIQINSLTKQLQDGQITQEEFDRRRIQIMREQAIREKAFNLFGAITNTAVAITAALKEGPIKAALVGALGAAQIAAIASQPLPAFKDGVIDLEGKGTGTSDENLAWLSRGESVITAKQTAKHKDALQAIHRDRFDQYITEAIAAKEMAKSQSLSETDAAAMAMISSAGVDSVGLIHAIQSSANKRNRNENKNAEYIASRISRSIAREGYYRNRYS